MDYVQLGRSGLKVSRLCLGCMTYGSPDWRSWVLDEAASRDFLKKALDAGINFFDTANFYSLGESERITGRLLQEFARRDEIVLATKVGLVMGDSPNARGVSRKHIMESIDASLRRLGTDYVDLYQIHRLDGITPLEETLEALDDVVRAGKALYVGASSMWTWQFMKALNLQERNGWARFVSMQNHYNLLYREEEREMLPACRAEGVGVIPWSPLARGRLTKAPGAGETERRRTDDVAENHYGAPHDEEIARRVHEVAGRLGVKEAQVALAWVLSRPGVTAPIVGASKPHHLDDAVAALELVLDEETMAYLEAPYAPRAVSGHS
ncbi:aldo/keto reductase [Kaustia mangrovi]|uniref:Aldo/keto reductase n=1 Tax=Kaustia mangrovi TaxID=2593653 RepID=A0A7S8C7M9_9HYPH|nr:aldo/keto reductase [Kaustia mangrovi]QPC44874.1 aldo/keto reductase [Kaustia mangrovi]